MKKNIIIIIVVLLVVNVFTLISYYKYRQQSIASIKYLANESVTEKDELYTHKVNFRAAILNSNIKLNEEIMVRDSLNSHIFLHDVFMNTRQPIVVCRFSETNCASCIKFSINMLREWIKTVKVGNVLFLATYRNNKILNKEKQLYNIRDFNVFNISDFYIPAEEEGYPYYFVLDSTLNISNLFFPDKATPEVTKKYLDLIQERHFLDLDAEKEKG